MASAKQNQKLSKLHSIGFVRSVYYNEYKIKMKIKMQEMSLDIFSNQT